MTKTLSQAVAIALAAIVTTATFAGANSIASHQYARAEVVAAAQMQVVAARKTVPAHRA